MSRRIPQAHNGTGKSAMNVYDELSAPGSPYKKGNVILGANGKATLRVNKKANGSLSLQSLKKVNATQPGYMKNTIGLGGSRKKRSTRRKHRKTHRKH